MKESLLPGWGPYSKYLAGAAYISDAARGVRVEFSFFPAIHRGRAYPPVHLWDCGFAPYEAAPDLRYWSYLFHPAEDRNVTALIHYARVEDGLEITASFRNGGAHPQALACHGLITRRFPERGPGRAPPLRPARVTGLSPERWRCASSYDAIRFREDRDDRHLPADARPTGMVWRDGMVDGRGLGDGFGKSAGNSVRYDRVPPAATLLLRYRTPHPVNMHFDGVAQGSHTLAAAADFVLFSVPVTHPARESLVLTSGGGSALELDGLAFLEAGAAPPGFVEEPLEDVPALTPGASCLECAFPGDPGMFRVEWPAGLAVRLRECYSDHIAEDFPLAVHDHVRRIIGTPGAKHYTHLGWHPIRLAAGESHTLTLRVTTTLPPSTCFHGLPAPDVPDAPPGIQRMQATVLTNVVYPVQHKRSYIAHHTPGKWWDSLYTWDSGFIGLALCEINPALAREVLATYLSEPGDDMAYVHHGSPVPVQIYLLQALFNRSGGDRALLADHFDGARRMHRFLAGRAEGSVTNRFRSGLLNPFPYFYNAGGWDDYPAQAETHRRGLASRTSPVITTAQMIRTAHLLRRMALWLDDDAGEFEADIERGRSALMEHAWNTRTRWFSYIVHDEDGCPSGPLLDEEGRDFNAGLDGLYPLISGICSPELEKELVERLKDPVRFWTPVGISTVDRSAPVYKPDGYWNGSVWMPHQWFFWRYLLDIGEGDFAFAIARRALDVWEREVEASGLCYEHFPIATGRGAGWHHFGGLSSPVLCWHAALNTPGRISGGYHCWTLRQRYTPDYLEADILLDGRKNDTPEVWVVFPAADTPDVLWNGKPLASVQSWRTLRRMVLPSGEDCGQLIVRVAGGDDAHARKQNPV